MHQGRGHARASALDAGPFVLEGVEARHRPLQHVYLSGAECGVGEVGADRAAACPQMLQVARRSRVGQGLRPDDARRFGVQPSNPAGGQRPVHPVGQAVALVTHVFEEQPRAVLALCPAAVCPRRGDRQVGKDVLVDRPLERGLTHRHLPGDDVPAVGPRPHQPIGGRRAPRTQHFDALRHHRVVGDFIPRLDGRVPRELPPEQRRGAVSSHRH